MGAKEAFFKQLLNVKVGMVAGSGGNSTLQNAATKGAMSVTLVSATGFTSGDIIIIGSGEDMEPHIVNGAPAGNVVSLTWGLLRAHKAADKAREGVLYDFGDPNEGGVSINFSGEINRVRVSTKRLPFAALKGYVSAGAEWTYPTFAMHPLAIALGMNLSRLSGTGAAIATPYNLASDGNEFGESTDLFVVAEGIRFDGTYAVAEFHGVSMDYTGLSSTFAMGQPATINVRARAASGGVLSTSLPGYPVTSTYRATKGKTWGTLVEVGLYSPSGATTTLSAPAAAEALSLTVTSSTGMAPGDWLLLGTGEQSELVWVDTVPNGTSVTLRTRTLRAHAATEPVVEQIQVPFAGITEEGATLSTGGSVRNLRLGTNRLEAGVIPGDADVTLNLSVGDISLANLAYALGIPQADISGGRLPFNTNVGTSNITAMYVKGLLEDTSTCLINAVGCSQLIENVALALNNADVAKLPISVQPAAAIQFVQYP